jgi:hemolysin D
MTARSSRRPDADDRAAQQALNDFQSDTAELTGAQEPLGTRMTLYLFGIMVITALVLMVVLSVDRVVATRGQIVSQTPTIVVQPVETAVIRAIEVREGQVVRAGTVLARLDPTFSGADLATLEQREQSLLAEIARLEAEAEGKVFVAADGDGFAKLQEAIHGHRSAELRSRLINYDQQIASNDAQIRRTENEIVSYRARLQLLREVETMRVTLERNQTGSRLNALIAADNRVEVERTLATAEGTLQTAGHDRAALVAGREEYLQQWRSATIQQIFTRRVELNTVREELAKARRRNELIELRAPDDAVVLEVARLSVGSVAEAAQPMFRLVPLNAPLEVEAEISGADQGFVKVGDRVTLKLDAYRYSEHGTAKGRVRWISDDSFMSPSDAARGRGPYFRTRIEITEAKLYRVPPDFRLIPGMPVGADIVIGDRTILSYLVSGIVHVGGQGLQEP